MESERDAQRVEPVPSPEFALIALVLLIMETAGEGQAPTIVRLLLHTHGSLAVNWVRILHMGSINRPLSADDAWERSQPFQMCVILYTLALLLLAYRGVAEGCGGAADREGHQSFISARFVAS